MRMPELEVLLSEKKVFKLLAAMVGSLAILTIVLQTGNLQAGVFKQTVFESGTEGYNIYRIPTIVKAANGDLLAFAEGRSGGDASEIDMVMKRSTDAGKTWGSLQVVVENNHYRGWDGLPTSNVTAGNQSPVVDLLDPQNPGRIWMPFTLENDRVFVTYSDDHGETWSSDVSGRAREITANVKLGNWSWYATGPVHGIQLTRGSHAGRLIIPSDHRIDGVSSWGAHVVYSDDHGQTWQRGATDTHLGSSSVHPNENVAVELVDGRVYFNARSQNGSGAGTRAITHSSTGGLTYDALFTEEPNIVTPVVQNSAIRFAATDEGDAENILIYSSPGQPNARRDFTIQASFDEGVTWTNDTLIHPGPAAYSDLVKLDSQNIGVLYEAGQSLYDEIVFGYFDFDDLDPVAWNQIQGDIDQNGSFDENDLEAYVAVWAPLSNEFFLGGVDSYTNGDLNFDGVNDLHDVFLMRQAALSAGFDASALESLAAVPETTSVGLLIVVSTILLVAEHRDLVRSFEVLR